MNRLGRWWQLWIVASAILPIVAIGFTWARPDYRIDGVFALPLTAAQADAPLRWAHKAVREIAPRCLPGTPRQHVHIAPLGQPDSAYVTCSTWRSLAQHLGMAGAASVVLLALGLAVAWLRRALAPRTAA